jgi:hypothetical protein
METQSKPIYARRLKLSTGAIFAALLLTGAAALAVFEMLGPVSVKPIPQAAVQIESPILPTVASEMKTDGKQASSDDGRLEPVRR